MANKVALITGSGKKRVGYHIATALAQRGYSLAIHYRSSSQEAKETVEELRKYSKQVESFQADLIDEKAVQKMVDAIIKEFGSVDVLVNTAAIWPRKKLEEVTAKDVRDNLETNTLGTFLCNQQVGLRMVQQANGGCIINFGDWAEIRPYLDYAAYFPSKGAIPALTRCMAVELASRNPKVRVNCLLPGPVMLPPDLSEEEKQQAINGTLVKREGSPQQVAHAVLSLIENDFITGVCLPIDGGRSIYAAD